MDGLREKSSKLSQQQLRRFLRNRTTATPIFDQIGLEDPTHVFGLDATAVESLY